MEKFRTELFAIALEKARTSEYNKLLENSEKQAETEGYSKKPKWVSHEFMAGETGVNTATIRNCLAAKYDIGINGLMALAKWAKLDINDFYK